MGAWILQVVQRHGDCGVRDRHTISADRNGDVDRGDIRPRPPPRLRWEPVLVVRPLAVDQDLAQLRAPAWIRCEQRVHVRRFLMATDKSVVADRRHVRRWVIGDRRERP